MMDGDDDSFFFCHNCLYGCDANLSDDQHLGPAPHRRPCVYSGDIMIQELLGHDLSLLSDPDKELTNTHYYLEDCKAKAKVVACAETSQGTTRT